MKNYFKIPGTLNTLISLLIVFLFSACSKESITKQNPVSPQIQQALKAQENSLPPSIKDGPDLSVAQRTANNDLTDADKQYLTDVAEGSKMELMLGGMTLNSASNIYVKGYGVRMYRDHAIQHVQIQLVGKYFGLNLPTLPNAEQMQKIRALSALHADAFDRAYISMMIDDHRMDITKTAAIANGSGNAIVRAVAAQWLPVLQSHLTHALLVAQVLGIKLQGES
ncbi:MAG: outer membrane protein [Bacteroidota bacterium]|nr:outer membrane protein [Bacteroidota bacterium]